MSHPSWSTRPAAAGDLLTIAFGAAVVMWAVGYFCRMIPHVPGWLLLGLLVGVQVAAGGYLATRTLRGGGGAVACGLMIGLINLLILGALLAEGEPSVMRMAVGVGGFLAVSVLLCLVGWMIGRRMSGSDRRPLDPDIDPARRAPKAGVDSIPFINWTGRFAIVAVAATFVLIVAGGLVTGWQAGLAVPDWPNTEGALMFLYPLSRMSGGVYYEHAHRLYGALVGLTTVALAAHLWILPRRGSGECGACGYDLRGSDTGICPECGTPRAAAPPAISGWVRYIALGAVILVIVQGIKGGLRVTGRFTTEIDPEYLQPNTMLAIAHGVTAQVFLMVITAIAVFTSTMWNQPRPPKRDKRAGLDRALAAAVVIALLIQLLLGATYRHLSRDPEITTGVAHSLYAHMAFAMVVLALIIVAGLRAGTHYAEIPPIRRTGKAMLHLVGLQFLLGIVAFVVVVVMRSDAEVIPHYEVWTTTAHQVTGAALIALATMYLLWTRRLLVATPAA